MLTIFNDYRTAPREGASVHGLFMEGARWDIDSGTIADSKIKELTSMMPVIFIKAVPQVFLIILSSKTLGLIFFLTG